jgi:predicted DNA-binding protein (MmcQ/YjbR family)
VKYPWIDEYCLSKFEAIKDFKVEWDVTRYLIGGKMFAMEGGESLIYERINLSMIG